MHKAVSTSPKYTTSHANARKQKTGTGLLISDDEILIVEIKQVFSRCIPQTVIRAASPNLDFIKLLKHQHPEFVLLDSNRDPESCLNILMAIRRPSSVPLITMSYTRDQSFPLMALELGADDCVTKPLRLHELAARTKACIRRRYLTTAFYV